MKFVLDASVALNWLYDDEHHEGAERLRQKVFDDKADMIAPPIFVLEIANNLSRSALQGRLTHATAARKLGGLFKLPIRILAPSSWPEFSEILFDLSLQYTLTAYDACYLGLARELRFPLATLDKQLAEAAREAGIKDAFEI